jgi:hypothetical protein
MYYIGFNPVEEDIKRAQLGITSASILAEFLVDAQRVLTKYKTHIAAFRVLTQIDFNC